MENPQSTQQPAPASSTGNDKRGNSYLVYIIGVTVIIIVIAGGIFAYKNFLNPELVKVTSNETKYPALESLESELNTLGENTIDSDFTELDKDLNSL